MILPPEYQKLVSDNLFSQGLWWSLQPSQGQMVMQLSGALEKLVGKRVESLESFVGRETSEKLLQKIDEIYQDCHPDNGEAYQAITSGHCLFSFVSEVDTTAGKQCFQNQLNLYFNDKTPLFLVACSPLNDLQFLDGSKPQMKNGKALLKHSNTYSHTFSHHSRFLAMLSHELRSPLLSMNSSVQQLLKEPEGGNDIRERLKTIYSSSEQSLYLINDILTYTQLEYDGLKLNPVLTPIDEIIERARAQAQPVADEKQVSLEIESSATSQNVMVDSTRLTQVLTNLVISVIKFTTEGNVRLVLVDKGAQEFVFKVQHSGDGIDTENMDNIFEPFAQIESQNVQAKQPFWGAGLALYVAQQLVSLMGSHIKVTSEKSLGSEFSFSLNLQALDSPFSEKNDLTQESERAVAVEMPEPSDSFEPSRDSSLSTNSFDQPLQILIADDSDINRMVLEGYLVDLNCEVKEARDGEEAWTLIQKVDFDYILLDIQMPYMDGTEVASRLNNYCQSGGQPRLKGVFAITAGGEIVKSETTNSDSTDYFDLWLFKPVTKKQVLEALELNFRGVGASTTSKNIEGLGSENAKNHKDDYQPVMRDVPSSFHHLLIPFINEVTSKLSEMSAMSAVGDTNSVSKAAHYLKGNAMLFQLIPMVDMLKVIEEIQESSEGDKQNTDKVDDSRHKKTIDVLQKIGLAIKTLEKSVPISDNMTQ